MWCNTVDAKSFGSSSWGNGTQGQTCSPQDHSSGRHSFDSTPNPGQEQKPNTLHTESPKARCGTEGELTSTCSSILAEKVRATVPPPNRMTRLNAVNSPRVPALRMRYHRPWSRGINQAFRFPSLPKSCTWDRKTERPSSTTRNSTSDWGTSRRSFQPTQLCQDRVNPPCTCKHDYTTTTATTSS